MVTKNQVESILAPDEPDYEAAARLGLAALPYLHELVREDDAMTAAKAAYLAARIGGPDSKDVLETAADSSYPEVRAAVVSATQLLDQDTAARILRRLHSDSDPAVAAYAARMAHTEGRKPGERGA